MPDRLSNDSYTQRAISITTSRVLVCCCECIFDSSRVEWKALQPMQL